MNLTADQVDALRELLNIGVGRAAGVLNEMLHSHIRLKIPSVELLRLDELRQHLLNIQREILSTVQLEFEGALSGTAKLVFPPDGASKLVSILTGEEPGTPDLDAVRAGALNEVGNIVLNGVMGSITNVLRQRLEFGLPIYAERTIQDMIASHLHQDANCLVVVACAQFEVERDRISGDVIVVFDMDSFDALWAAIDAIVTEGVHG